MKKENELHLFYSIYLIFYLIPKICFKQYGWGCVRGGYTDNFFFFVFSLCLLLLLLLLLSLLLLSLVLFNLMLFLMLFYHYHYYLLLLCYFYVYIIFSFVFVLLCIISCVAVFMYVNFLHITDDFVLYRRLRLYYCIFCSLHFIFEN